MHKIRLISIVFLVLLTMTMGTWGGVALADSPENVTPNITAEEAQKQNEEIAKQGTLVIDPAVKQKCDEWQARADLEREKALTPKEGIGTLSTEQIPLGTNKTFTAAGEGAYWSSHWGLATASAVAVLQYNQNKVYSYAWAIGGGSGGAWNGRRFQITGSGSRNAYVDFYGTAYESSTPGLSGNTNWQIKAIIYDVTTSTIIGQTTIYNASHSNSLLSYTDGGSIGNSILVSFQAGHEYVVKVETTGDCSEYGSFVCVMDSNNGNYTTKWSSIRLRWM
ncbi:MAG: hypothetical protein JW967_10545 [Dehalococcoidales bacterium]|nr:hypothetical protein [Dehalococcoidales bacterium]